MREFSSKVELVTSYIKEAGGEMLPRCVNAVYVPHKYRGGYVIRGYGYSTERIGTFVKKERSGDPRLV